MILAPDSDALSALAGPDSTRKRHVRRAVDAAARRGQRVVTPTVVLAESYRGTARVQQVDSLLARHKPAIHSRNTDRSLARFVGAVLHASRSGVWHVVDAHVVAVAAEAGGGLILTGEASDIAHLAAPYRSTIAEALVSSWLAPASSGRGPHAAVGP